MWYFETSGTYINLIFVYRIKILSGFTQLQVRYSNHANIIHYFSPSEKCCITPYVACIIVPKGSFANVHESHVSFIKLRHKGRVTTTACANYRGPVLPRYVGFSERAREPEYPEKTLEAQKRSTEGTTRMKYHTRRGKIISFHDCGTYRHGRNGW